MKQKKYFILAAAAALFAACSSDDIALQEPATQPVVDQAVNFGAYINRATTRAGQAGTMTLQTDGSRKLQETGFGVFGYYTDNNEYDQQTIPNFFYNQKVTWNSTYWTYTPIKYWPNEYGSSAIADDNDKVSYFAYAPYVDVTPSTGKPADQAAGITLLSRNSATGDPYVKYIASFDWSKNVDLLWGVVPADKTNWSIVSGQTQTLAAGMPWLNVERPNNANTQASDPNRVKFQFQHALSKLNVQVDYDADDVNHNTDNTINSTETRIYVRSVTFTGFSMKGTLNLNNTEANTPLWLSYDGESDLETGIETTVYDGRKDGREGISGATNEKNNFLNPALIQTKAWTSDNIGVRSQPQNLFAFPHAAEVAEDMLQATPTKQAILTADEAIALGVSSAATTVDYGYASDPVPNNQPAGSAMLKWPVMVIPNGEELTITIVYDVETVDKKLATMLSDGQTIGSSIENRITKTITFSGSDKNYMEAGKQYIVKLHLGMNSVKFDADVTDWDPTVISGETWLPSNARSYQAPGNYNYYVSATTSGASEAFTLTGFSSGEYVTAVHATPANATATDGQITSVTLTGITENTSVLNKTQEGYATFTGGTSGKVITMNLVQAACQPKVNTAAPTCSSQLNISGSTGTFTLRDGNHGTELTGAVWIGDTRNVSIISAYRNGLTMTEVDENATPNGELQFKCSADKTITLGAAAHTGEVFIFTVKAGDAGVVTIKCTVL